MLTSLSGRVLTKRIITDNLASLTTSHLLKPFQNPNVSWNSVQRLICSMLDELIIRFDFILANSSHIELWSPVMSILLPRTIP